ncbi:AAA-domain-containing protein [Gyrodon lividus]|nr:AAA-domain-containing protein [Gyrodon lividus]
MRRSSQLIGRTRTLLSAPKSSSRILSSPTLARTKLPKDAHSNSTGNTPSRTSSKVHKRLASSQPVLDEHQQEQSPPVDVATDSPPENDPPPVPHSHPAPDKPPRRPRASSSASPPKDTDDRPQLPSGLDILWVPDAPPDPEANALTNNTLPPPELFEEALTSLHITLHPQTQHRAAFSSPAGPPVEPTLALYCPVEGGEYVVDETVRQLARRTGAEVLIIDSAQLAAGEWGHFGKAANAIQLPRNPLHYHPAPAPSPSRRSSLVTEDDDDPEPGFFPPLGVSQMTLHVLAPVAASRGRPSSVFVPSRSATPPSRIKAFFDDLINMPSPTSSKPSQPQRIRPRLIYIRDFPTLAPTAPTWYPHLLSAVRARRTGPITRPSSPVACPMTIVCGVTPPLVGSSGSPAGSFFMSFGAQTPSSSGSAGGHVASVSRRRHTARPSSGTSPSSSSPRSDTAPPQPSSAWGEDDHATRAREKRLRERLRRWERGGDAALLEEVPRLFVSSLSGAHSIGNGEGNGGSQTSASTMAPADFDTPRPPIFLLGGSSPVLDMLGAGQGEVEDVGAVGGGPAQGKFFRASVILPGARDFGAERRCRMARRREVNELAMRMGVGGIGGVLDAGGKTRMLDGVNSVSTEEVELDGEVEIEQGEKAIESTYGEREADAGIIGSSADAGEHKVESDSTSLTGIQYPEEHEMWEDWSTRVEPWSSIRQIADRAVGSAVSSSILSPPASASSSTKTSSTSLEPTSVSWSAIHRAWAAQRSSRDLRRTWSKDARVRAPREHQLDDGTGDELDALDHEDGEGGKPVDEVVERVKQDNDLDPHEKRLLGCIVDPATLSTTFAQVHLPPHTIDSVRTLVSLPLLHPVAFQTGILKEHAMTGCLLFGPPGTGKTLVVRALAKEAGCRMLMVSPSDVMDMYVGEGEKLVKAVFTLARRLSPCVVFLDEIDALFGARSSARDSGGAMAHRGVITEFMQEMDGLKSQSGTEERVVVIGATNRPFDLDDAVLRRLPRRLLVDLPGDKEREGILNILLRDETLAPDVDAKTLAKQTESFSGSDLKHLCVSAALDAVKEGVSVPWKSSPEAVSTNAAPDDSLTTSLGASASVPPPTGYSRTIHPRHFDKALKEITPSSSESLGSLADLRKWNEQFGEGRKEKRRIQVWGKGKFGFVDAMVAAEQNEGRVADPRATAWREISIDR